MKLEPEAKVSGHDDSIKVNSAGGVRVVWRDIISGSIQDPVSRLCSDEKSLAQIKVDPAATEKSGPCGSIFQVSRLCFHVVASQSHRQIWFQET
jgi:hypothetical protein